MVLRPDALRRRLLKLEEVISGLEELGSRGGAGASQPRDRWALERGLQLGAEIVLDIGNHILSAHYGVSADNHEDVITQLHVRGVIDESLRERLRGLGGFRNILVHDYVRLDADRVESFAARAPGDFSAFAHAVREWIAATLDA
jgi:uncharacterized protein YutE (UPF0331/DUF86 family)